MALKSNSNFKKKNSIGITKDPLAQKGENKANRIHNGLSWKTLLELRGRSEFINQASARAFSTTRAGDSQSRNTKHSPFGKGGRRKDNRPKNVSKVGSPHHTAVVENSRPPRFRGALDALRGRNVGNYNAVMRVVTRLRYESKKKESQEEEFLSERMTARKLQLALKNRELEYQARKFSYKLRLTGAAVSGRPADQALKLPHPVVAAAREYARRTQLASDAKRALPHVLRFSQSSKAVFERRGRRYVFRELSRHDYLPRRTRPAFAVPRLREALGPVRQGYYMSYSGWDDRRGRGWFRHSQRVRRRPWGNMTFNRTPINTSRYKKGWSYTNALSYRSPRNAYVRALREAARALKERTPRFTPTNRVLYRRWHTNRTRRGVPLQRHTFIQEHLDWWEKYVNEPREKRGLEPWGPLDPTYRAIEVRGGSPATAGYRRRRRVSLPQFNVNRGWRPALLPHPAQQATLSFAKGLLSPAIQNLKKIAARAAVWRRFQTSDKLLLMLSGRSVGDYRKVATSVHRRNYLARRGRELRISTTKYCARQGDNFKHFEAAPLFSRAYPSRRSVGASRTAEYTVSSHPMWREFIRRRKSARHGVGGSVERLHTFVRKLQKLLTLEGERLKDSPGQQALRFTAMQDVLKQYGNKEHLSWQRAFEKYLTRCRGYVEYSTQASNSASDALFRFSVSTLTEKGRSALKDDMAFAHTNLVGDGQITEKTFSKSYQFWLSSAQRFMKKSATTTSSPNYGEDHAEEVIDLGTTRLRFPAAGRRKASYDRAVRNFYNRAAYPQYRRVHRLRFTKIRPVARRTHLSFLPAHEPSALLRLKQRVSQNSQVPGYYNRRWRALLNKRSAQVQDKWGRATIPAQTEEGYGQGALTKRRMDNSAIRAAFNDTLVDLQTKPAPVALAATREALLARALRGRRKAKGFTKLRGKLYRRRPPAEQTFPSWFYARWERKRYKKRTNPKKSRYNVSPERGASSAPFWRASVFDLSINKDRPEQDVLTIPTGESLTWLEHAYRRERAFSHGPTLVQQRVPKRFQKVTAATFAGETSTRAGLDELEQRRWEAEKRKKIREKEGLDSPLPLKPCGINRRRWVRLRTKAHRGFQQALRQMVLPCTATRRKWHGCSAQALGEAKERQAHAVYSKERTRLFRGYTNSLVAARLTPRRLKKKYKTTFIPAKRSSSYLLGNVKARRRLHKRLQSVLTAIAKWEKAQTAPVVARRKSPARAHGEAQLVEVLGRVGNWARIYGAASYGTQRFLKTLSKLPNSIKQEAAHHIDSGALSESAFTHQLGGVRDRTADAVYNLTLLERLLTEYRVRDRLSFDTAPAEASANGLGEEVSQCAEKLAQEWLTGRGKRFLGFKRENLHRRDIRRGPSPLPSPGDARAHLNAKTKFQRSNRYLQATRRLRDSFRNRLVKDQFYQSSAMVPFTFALPTRERYVSDAEKERHAAAKRARRLEHYRKTSHLTETFTNFVPQLLHMLKNLTIAPKIYSYTAMRGLVAALYWSLRFYMRRDYSGRRQDLRELNSAQLNTLRQQVSMEAAYRYFDSLDEDNMRRRFQKRKLAPRPDLSDGALRWLRTFFPSRYSFYLEDEDKYSPLYVTPSRVYRAHPSRNNPGTWRTDSLDDALEVRLKRLTGMRARRTTPRFEGMLATIKRTPAVSGQGGAARKRSTVGASRELKTSFFSRPYSTTAHRSAPQRPTLVINQLTAVKRRTAFVEGALSDTAVATWHRRVKESAYARESRSYAPAPRELGAGALDPRLARLKSLRNREYLLRQGSAGPTLNAFHNQRRLRAWKAAQKSAGTSQPLCLNSRRKRLLLTSLRPHRTAVVERYRRSVHARRTRTLVEMRAATAYAKLAPRKLPRLYGSTARAQARTLYNRRRALRQFASATFHTPGQGARVTYPAVVEQRSPLLLQNVGGQRDLKTYERGFSIAHGALRILRGVSYKSSLGLRAQGARIAEKVRRRSVPAIHLQGEEFTVAKKQQVAEYWANGTRPRRFSRVREFRHVGGIPAGFRAKTLGRLLSHRARGNAVQVSDYFTSNTRRQRSRQALVSRALAKGAQKFRENLFALRRDEAWNEITLRWMKKERKLKNWLKFRKLKLKSKKIKWSILPEPIFKRMRSRLRKLEWRESDERFDRPGLWNAFSFHPKERRKAQWLEWAMYRRALYSTRRHKYRRHQFPREQKRLKWLQFMRKTIYAPKADKVYIKGRRWSKVRIYNNRLFRSLFHLRNDRAAMRHFQKLARRRPKLNGFAHSLRGLADRLDVNLMLLNLAPTVFWARLIAALGVFKVNGRVVRQAAHQLHAGDRVEWDLVKLERIRANFQPYHTKSAYAKFRVKNSSASVPTNFLYFPQIRAAIYKGLPAMEEIRKNSRLNPLMFKLFKADVSATY